MDYERLKDILMNKPLEELYTLRGEQYGSKEKLVDDIIAHDDGCLEEILELEGSLLFFLMGRRR
ncbi:MAG: hypothetical protein ACK4WF_03405 [Candidatus Brocadiales bacterium]